MIKIVVIAIVLALILFVLKSINNDFFAPAIITAGIILTYFILSYLKEAYSFINKLIEMSGIDFGIYKIIFKIVGVSYLVEFGAGTIDDMGYKSIADKLILIGKLSIFIMSMPIFYGVVNLIISLVQ